MFLYKIDKTVDRFPFQTLENTDPVPDITWQQLGFDQNGYALVVVDSKLSYGEPVTELLGFRFVKTNEQITKKDIVSSVYPVDVEAKILRDSLAGRNQENFQTYDAFIESIPSA